MKGLPNHEYRMRTLLLCLLALVTLSDNWVRTRSSISNSAAERRVDSILT